MIKNHDRSGWFGASDTSKIMGNWDTDSFRKWWLVKLGVRADNFVTPAMMAGTAYEHHILDHLGIATRDRQIRKRRLRLRVNLDGETDIIHEVKTYSADMFTVSKAYRQQCQVEMFASKKDCEIIAYRLNEAEYQNYFLEIEPERISRHPIEYDPGWITAEYLPRLKYLAHCLRRRKTPTKEGFNAWQAKSIIGKIIDRRRGKSRHNAENPSREPVRGA